MVVFGAGPVPGPIKRSARRRALIAKLCENTARPSSNRDDPELLKSWRTEASEETRAPSDAPHESERTPRRFSCDVQRDYVLDTKPLGCGGLCDEVTSAWPRQGGAKVAVKRTSLREVSVRKLADCRREAELHLGLEHPHIVALHRVYENELEQSLVLEHLEGGDALDLIARRGTLPEAQAAGYLRQALLALEYLHARGVVHMDVKPENLVFADARQRTLKLIDFGLSRRWDGRTPLSDARGTPTYMAPEAFRGSYGSKADLWSLGVVAYVFLCGCAPWVRDEEESLAMIKAGAPRYSPSRFHEALSAEAQDFVRALLADEAQRLDATAALRHPWLRAPQATGFWAAVTGVGKLL